MILLLGGLFRMVLAGVLLSTGLAAAALGPVRPAKAVTGYRVYLPVIYRAQPFSGRLHNNGAGIGGEDLYLLYTTDSGATYHTYATTISQADGSFAFGATPPVDNPDHAFFVTFPNIHDNPNYLYTFDCNTVSRDYLVYTCDINAANVKLNQPGSGASLSLPITFTWQRRPTTDDSYIWNLFDPVTGDVTGQTSPMGYVSSFTFDSSFITKNYIYGWRVDVLTPSGLGIGFPSGGRDVVITGP